LPYNFLSLMLQRCMLSRLQLQRFFQILHVSFMCVYFVSQNCNPSFILKETRVRIKRWDRGELEHETK
jgi:hypothetical protein